MKKLFLIGIFFAGSIGLSIAATQNTQEEAVTICWNSSCGKLHCGAYYLSDEISVLAQEIADSEKDCPEQIP